MRARKNDSLKLLRQARSQLQERIWLVSLGKWLPLSRVASLLDEDPHALALVLADTGKTDLPIKKKQQAGDLQVKALVSWMMARLVRELRLKRRPGRALMESLGPGLPGYGRKHWLETSGHIKETLLERGISEHILVDLAMLAGFSLWMDRYTATTTASGLRKDRERVVKQDDRQLRVTLEQLDFPHPDRLELVAPLSPKLRRCLMEHTPAGELAYHSLEMALRQKLEEHRPRK